MSREWIDHDGGKMPVSPDTLVDLRFRSDGPITRPDGHSERMSAYIEEADSGVRAGDLYWGRDPEKTGGATGEIVAWRLSASETPDDS